MTAPHGKLNFTVTWFGFSAEVAINKNPDRYRGRGFAFSPQWLLTYQSLR